MRKGGGGDVAYLPRNGDVDRQTILELRAENEIKFFKAPFEEVLALSEGKTRLSFDSDFTMDVEFLSDLIESADENIEINLGIWGVPVSENSLSLQNTPLNF